MSYLDNQGLTRVWNKITTSFTELETSLKSYIDNKYTAGNGIDITNGVISTLRKDDEIYFKSIKVQNNIPKGALIVGTGSGYKPIEWGKSFVITYPVLVSHEALTQNAVGENCCSTTGIVDLKVVNNGSSVYLTPYKVVYIRGTLSGVTFTVDLNSMFTTDVPSTNDGLYYYLLGYAISADEIELFPYHEVFKRDQNGWFGPIGANILTAGTGINISNGQISLDS